MMSEVRPVELLLTQQQVDWIERCLELQYCAESLELIQKLRQEWEGQARDERGERFIALARESAHTELEVDDHPRLSPTDEGTWVAAWVWISNDEAGICADCDERSDSLEYPDESTASRVCPACLAAYEKEETE